MSRPSWWRAVAGMLREYPSLCAEVEAIHQSNMIANYSGSVRGSEASRSTENIALRQLSPAKQYRYDVITEVLEYTRHTYHGHKKIKMVEMVYFKGTATLEGAALALNYSVDTVYKFNQGIFHAIAKKMQLDG